MSTISGIVVVAAFWVAAGIFLSRVLSGEMGAVGIIAVVCFAAGGIIRLLVLLRHRSVGDSSRNRESAEDESPPSSGS